MKNLILTLTLLLLLLSLPAWAGETAPTPIHALAMHGAPKYGANFTHFDYTNPDAPKGGALKLAGMGTFDTLNPYTVKGVSVEGIGLIYASLTEQSTDEAFTAYAGLAESIEVPEDRSWIIYTLRPQAQWEDGKPVTAEDVKWSFETLMKDGQPFYKGYYADIIKVEALSDKRVKFTFKGANNLELPLIVGQVPVLPKHYWEKKDFTATTLEPPPGSGPYRIGKFEAGRSITYERVKGWWGENLPPYKGRYNFDSITYEYFRDRDVQLEALFGGTYDFHQEYTAKLWATAYNAPAVKDGRVIKKEVKNALPQGMQGFVYNTRRPVFQDKAVRQALDYAFDFDWGNKQFAYSAYTRSNSYFANSEMAAPDHPPEGRVKEILEQFKDKLPADIFTTRYQPPKTDGSGNNRDNLKTAMKILDSAGYKIGPGGLRVHPKTGKALEFEFLTNGGNAAFERWIMPFIQNLKKMGVKATFRVVDDTQYTNRVMNFDFDMTVSTFGQSLNPGNEQRELWASTRADTPGSRNLIGLKNPAIDALVEMMIAAPTREELVARAQALDYVLLSGHYVIPNWYISAWRIAYWDKFGQPETQAPYALGYIDTWWVK
ncbi:MAG: extracellular solute-binding protein [Alphaproteobacteria bacterium]